jgi:hypothetical protein
MVTRRSGLRSVAIWSPRPAFVERLRCLMSADMPRRRLLKKIGPRKARRILGSMR